MVEAHVADFVHEERAAVSGLKQPAAVFVRSGKGAAHVSEQLRFEQGFRKGAAIDGDERRFRAGAVLVNGAGDEFFSRAAFSSDQHAAGLRRDRFDQVEKLAHLRARADDVVEAREPAQLAAQVAGLFLQSLSFGDALHRGPQFIEQPVALDDVAVGAEIHGVDCGVDGWHAGDQNENR